MMSTVTSLTQRSTYEFTKRKRWSDLLITDLVDSVLFILSPSCIVLYVATAVNELLGWRDVDLVDVDFIKLINPADHDAFRTGFEHSKHGSDIESTLQLRLICNELPGSLTQISKDLLVEIKLYPQRTHENATETKCVFATATPFSSRNTAALNTLLDLKAENRRLQRKVMDYKSRIGSSTHTQSPTSQANPMYATSSLHPTPRVLLNPCQNVSDPSNSFDQVAVASGSNYSLDFTETLYGPNGPNINLEEANLNEGSKKKKSKKAQSAEQYVCITCGRTDSPEWRKGPLGPKTLCNACGLRWAKQMRKVDDSLLVEGTPQSTLDKNAEI